MCAYNEYATILRPLDGLAHLNPYNNSTFPEILWYVHFHILTVLKAECLKIDGFFFFFLTIAIHGGSG